jgi:hypothetical protein
MQLSVREAATLLGRSPRTVRAQLIRGDLPGRKTKGRWRIERRHLPLTENQRVQLQSKADALRRTVDEALPPRLARTAGERHRSLMDLDAFRLGASLLAELRAEGGTDAPQPGQGRVVELLEGALLSLAEAVQQYDRDLKVAALCRCRAGLARATGLLALAMPIPPSGPMTAWLLRLETEVLPAVAGFSRWAEGLRRRKP